MSHTFTMRWTPEEEKLFKGYAALSGENLAKLFKDALTDYILEEYDMDAILEYEDARKNGTLELVSWDDAWKEIGV